MQEKISAQYLNEIEMAKAQRDYELKKAVYDIEVFTKKAESEMAYQLQVKQLQPNLLVNVNDVKDFLVLQCIFGVLVNSFPPLTSISGDPCTVRR